MVQVMVVIVFRLFFFLFCNVGACCVDFLIYVLIYAV